MTRAHDILREHQLEEERALRRQLVPDRRVLDASMPTLPGERPVVEVSSPTQGHYFRNFERGKI